MMEKHSQIEDISCHSVDAVDSSYGGTAFLSSDPCLGLVFISVLLWHVYIHQMIIFLQGFIQFEECGQFCFPLGVQAILFLSFKCLSELQVEDRVLLSLEQVLINA